MMHGYSKLIGDAAHDLSHLKKMIDRGNVRDDQVLKEILDIADNLKNKAFDEANSIYSQPVLFSHAIAC